MQAQGCHPDAAVFNSLMEVLWQSGVILAQVRALQLWSLANRNGQFRIYTNSRQETDTLQYSTVCFTTGAAVVTVLRWLAELRCVGQLRAVSLQQTRALAVSHALDVTHRSSCLWLIQLHSCIIYISSATVGQSRPY